MPRMSTARWLAVCAVSGLLMTGCGGANSSSDPTPVSPLSPPTSSTAGTGTSPSTSPISPDDAAGQETISPDTSGGLLPPILPSPSTAGELTVPSPQPTGTVIPSVPSAGATSGSTVSTGGTDVSITTDTSTNTTRYVWGPITIFQSGTGGAPVIQVAAKTKLPAELITKTLSSVSSGGVAAKQVSGPSDVLLVNYTMYSLKTGKPVASTWERNAASTLRASALPSGWAQGMSGMIVGERRLLVIPAELTTGKAANSIPGVTKGDMAVVVVDLLDVVPINATPVQPTTAPTTGQPTTAPTTGQPTTGQPTTGQPTPSPTPTPSPSAVFQPLPLSMFGLHVPWALPNNYPVSSTENARWDGQWPDVSFGTLRLWDTRTTWAMLEPVQGQYNWNVLDGQIAQAKQNNVSDFVLVLSGTPEWAASGPAPDSAAWIGPNSASPPKSDADWVAFITATATKYKGIVKNYQIWNEPNSPLFWQGTPDQLAHLIVLAKKTIRKIDPAAKIIAPGPISSEKVSPLAGRQWWNALADAGWPVDVVTLHVYPSPKQGLDGFTSMVNKGKNAIIAAGWTGPIWVTEVSYVDRDGKPIPPQLSRELVAKSYWSAWNLGIKRMYWYAWSPPLTDDPRALLLLQTGNPGALGYQDAYNAGRDVTPSNAVTPG